MFRLATIVVLVSVAVSAQRYGGYSEHRPQYSGYHKEGPQYDRYHDQGSQYGGYPPRGHYEGGNPYKPEPQYHARPQYEQEYAVTAHTYIQGVGNYSHVRGTLTFSQTSRDGPVTVLGEIIGLTPGQHGMHIHEKGDTGDECKAAGPHFNPFKKQHGAPTDVERHVGDLGNIETPPGGQPTKTRVYIVDNIISLSGERSILNRAIVLHAGRDDLGRGGNEESKKTGNSGARVGCGVIVPDQPERHY